MFLSYLCSAAFAQKEIEKDTADITSLLNEVPLPKQKVSATFKTTRIINMQSNETVHKRTLDFRVANGFEAGGKKGGGN